MVSEAGRKLRKAVIPVAGLGTRFLPITKAVPKELLPLVDRPALQYAVEECARVGIDDVLLVTATGKTAVEDHFDRRPDLEDSLARDGKHDLLEAVLAPTRLARVHAVRQPEPLGLGHAVLMGREHVGDQPFAVFLPDDVLAPDADVLERMLAAHARTGRPVVALMAVPPDEVHRYGVVRAEPGDHEGEHRVTDLVEKPPVDEAPSNLIVVARYVLTPDVFALLADTPPGAGGEIQLTDALRALARDEPIIGIEFDPRDRYDTGEPLGYLQATVSLALEHPRLGPPFREWLADLGDRQPT